MWENAIENTVNLPNELPNHEISIHPNHNMNIAQPTKGKPSPRSCSTTAMLHFSFICACLQKMGVFDLTKKMKISTNTRNRVVLSSLSLSLTKKKT